MSTGSSQPRGSRDTTPSPELIEAYLDGLLSPEESRVIERLIAADPALNAHLQLERSIEQSLRAQFAPPVSIALNLPAAHESSLPSTPTDPIPISRGVDQSDRARSAANRWTLPRSVLSIAAALLLATVGLWAAGVVSPYGILGITPPGLISPDSLYERKVASGFRPDWVCTTDAEFEDVARKNFGEALQLPKMPGIEIVGWAYYEPVLSDKTCLLLTKIDGREAIIAIDFRKNARSLSAPSSSGLTVYSRKFGNVAMYQTSKKGTRNILLQIYNPDKTTGPDTCDSKDLPK